MDYGIQTSPGDGTADGSNVDKVAATVPMSIAEALSLMHSRQSQALGQGSVIGELMTVDGPVSVAGNSPCSPTGMDHDSTMDQGDYS